MVTVLLATHLSELVDGNASRVRSIKAKAGPWLDFVHDVRASHPRLAARVFSENNNLAPGFALVVNDEVVHGKLLDMTLNNQDEVCILVTIAGGTQA